MYDIFISYAHRDHVFAAELQRELQSLGKKWADRRALRVFLDETDLATTPDLWEELRSHIVASRYFVLIASTHLQKSSGVSFELTVAKESLGNDRTLLVLRDGHLNWDHQANRFSNTDGIAFPTSLLDYFAAEPKYTDSRGDLAVDNNLARKAALPILAKVTGISQSDIESQELQSYRQVQRALLLFSLTRYGLAFFICGGVSMLSVIWLNGSAKLLLWPVVGFTGAALSGERWGMALKCAGIYLCAAPFYTTASYHTTSIGESFYQSLLHLIGWILAFAVLFALDRSKPNRSLLWAAVAASLVCAVLTQFLQVRPPYCTFGCEVLSMGSLSIYDPASAVKLGLQQEFSEHNSPFYLLPFAVSSIAFGMVLGYQRFKSSEFQRSLGLST
jgi:TIR domain